MVDLIKILIKTLVISNYFLSTLLRTLFEEFSAEWDEGQGVPEVGTELDTDTGEDNKLFELVFGEEESDEECSDHGGDEDDRSDESAALSHLLELGCEAVEEGCPGIMG